MFTVIRSSAGAGKTHALVKHYLERCLRTDNPAAYREVLALTFTNKAAAEMRQRALEYLRKLSAEQADSPPLADVMGAVKRSTGLDETGVARRAGAVLRHMLHHYGEVAISTIDAFTRRVARPFTRDLRLDQALRMTTDIAWYQDRAVDAVIAEAGIREEVTRPLTLACEQLLEDEGRWDPAGPLRTLAGELDKERSIAPIHALQAMDAQALDGFAKKLREDAGAERERIRAAGRKGLAIMKEAGVPDDAWAFPGKGGPLSWFRSLAAFDKTMIQVNSNLRKVVEGGKWHGSKASRDAIARIEAAAPALGRAVEEAARVLEEAQPRYFLRKAIRDQLPTMFTLRELGNQLERLKQDDGVTFFSDLTRRVAAAVRDEPVPWVLERMGERYRHYLIDEFQDTSLLQWQCLLPLIDNALASGGSAFIVGDAKQAIYRWRNGEARLLTAFPGLHGKGASALDAERERSLRNHYREGEALVANRRSAITIVRFNNALFKELPNVLPDGLKPAYAQHEQEPHRQEEGLVRIATLADDVTGDAARQAADGFLLESVEEALGDGFAPGDIAVLVRTAKAGMGAAEVLKAHGHAVVSPDAGALAGSDAAQAIADLMRVALARDEAAAARALQRMARLDAAPDAALAAPPFEARRGAALEQAEAWLARHGDPALRTTLTAHIEALAAALGLDPAQDGQLLAFLDEAHGFGQEHGQDIAAFLDHWERKGSMRAADAMEAPDAIRIMTIHKAKGLEFPVVVMPSVSMSAKGPRGEMLWVGTRGVLPGLDQALVEAKKALQDAGIEEVQEEAEQGLLDALNLLYVAFTRAEQRLYALAKKNRADAITKKLLDFLVPAERDGACILGSRRPPWPRRNDQQPTLALEPGPAQPLEALPLRFEAPEGWDPDDPDLLRRRGNLVHLLLSRLRDADGLPAALEALQRDGTVDAEEAARLGEEIAPLLRSPDLARWFAPGLDARTEATIITADGHALRPDRVITDGWAARVLDIKTGARSARHHEQVQGYMRVLQEMGHAPVEGALLYVREGALEPVGAA